MHRPSSHLSLEIGCLGVTHGDGGMVPSQQVRHWSTDDLAAPQHHCSLALDVRACHQKNPYSTSYIVKGKMVGIYDYQEILFLPTPWMSEGLFLPSFPGIIIKMAISREAASVRFYKSGSLIKFYYFDA